MKFALLSVLVALCGAFGAPLATAQSAAAETSGQPVLVELFASHNCRACPKAHRTLKTVSAEDPDVLVITWSVDYWDYLGDADPMAMKESVERQHAYVEQFGLRGPYTPQTVYNGLAQCPGNRPRAVRRKIDKAREASAPGASITRMDASLLVEGGDAAAGSLVLVEFLADDAHDTGMRHPVTKVRTLTQFEGGKLEIAVPACTSACAVLLETPGHGIPAALKL